MLCVCLFAVCFAGCGKKTAESGKVYYLNFKPEQDSAWQQLAADYTNETGIKVSVVTAAQGTYEETLTAEIDKSNAPTLFQVSGITALDAWKDYCLDLSDTKLADELTSDDFALKADGKTYGIAYVYEGFGLITNTALLEKAGYKTDDIKSFDDLKRIAEDIHARRDTLGFDAFTSSTLDSSSSWRFSGHLATVPLYYEFKDDDITEQPSEIKGTYLDRYKALWICIPQIRPLNRKKSHPLPMPQRNFRPKRRFFIKTELGCITTLKKSETTILTCCRSLPE